MLPEVGDCSPVMSFMSVLFPAPFLPTRPILSCSLM